MLGFWIAALLIIGVLALAFALVLIGDRGAAVSSSQLTSTFVEQMRSSISATLTAITP